MSVMSGQQFCLKWNNYQSNMSEVFQSMLISESLVDCTLACEGENLKAHKMVLAACSPYFQSLFLTNPCKHPIVILKDVRFVELKAIIDFMYRGEVNVSQDQLSALLKTAETLKVKGLAEVTEKQARGQPQLQNALFGSAVATTTGTSGTGKRRRKRSKKSGKESTGEMSSESDEENGIPSKRHMETGMRAASQRLTQQRMALEKETIPIPDQQQVESSRILEQSMATAEVVGSTENGQELIPNLADVQTLDDEAMSHTLFDEGTSLTGQTTGEASLMIPGPSGASQATIIVFGQGANATTAPNAINIARNSKNAGNTPTLVGKFECDVCKLKFASNYNLKRHHRTHDQDRPRWQCSWCDKSFTRRDSLPKHINFVHKEHAVKDEMTITTASPEPPACDA